MGALPNVYPGYQAVTDTAIKKKFEDAWGSNLNPTAGLTLTGDIRRRPSRARSRRSISSGRTRC